MHIYADATLKDVALSHPDPDFRCLLSRLLTAISCDGEFDPAELVRLVVIEPGDVLDTVNTELNFTLTPNWEICDREGGWYALTYSPCCRAVLCAGPLRCAVPLLVRTKRSSALSLCVGRRLHCARSSKSAGNGRPDGCRLLCFPARGSTTMPVWLPMPTPTAKICPMLKGWLPSAYWMTRSWKVSAVTKRSKLML